MRLQVLFMTVALLATGVAVSRQARAGAQDEYTGLAERRPLITLPAYSADEKEAVAKQALVILRDLYVNRLRKMEAYGVTVDPVPAAEDVVADARRISTDELHARLERIFASQHDLHLSYLYPKPYACYRSLLPFSLAEARDAAGRTVVAVAAIAKSDAVLDLAPEARGIAVGDVLTAIDGVAPMDAAKAIADLSGGSNEFGSLRRAIESLTYQSQARHRLPENDAVSLTFLSRQGDTYVLELPWISRLLPDCLETPDTEPVARVRGGKGLGADEYQLEFERLFKPQQRVSELEILTDTIEPIVHYDVLENEHGRIGYLRLDSFVPERLSIEATVSLVKGLLERELAGTDGLIIDLRDNGGGYISFAESLVQLFTPKDIQPMGFRLLSSDANRRLFAAIPAWEDSFRAALDVARTIGATYTAGLPMTAPLQANGLGQSYFKPVAVLTNSSCYSSCDMMSALLQDHGVATIYGEDGATGGGGANNIQLSYVLANLPAGHTEPYAALPAGQGMGFAWRQTVRVGARAGQLIEETGIRADKLVMPSTYDFMSQSSLQTRAIAADLVKQAASNRSWFKLQSSGRVDLSVNTPLSFALKASDTEAVELRIAGKSVGYQTVQAPVSRDGTLVAVSVPSTPELRNAGTVEVIGYARGERVWRGIQPYRLVPAPTAVADGARLVQDFGDRDVSPLATFTVGADASQGWTVQNGRLKAGLGDRYPDNLTAEASLFLDLTGRSQQLTLSFDIEGETELDYDFFFVEAVTADGVDSLLSPVSGPLAAERMSFDLTPYLGKQVELRMSFTSDGGVTARGVSIGHLVVE